ncbi:quercetin 2,3-dioxygenase [Marinobacterium nitratireducens]|uniref:Quercetin 2,3-dioxygenase n=1 Tax=Marinobacterium nitratireducens TaxID=518897 RepID=A0A918DPB1_9GAMM|nr:pirin family protein [Marinobacterium nitratireducens]GGO78266.1 quercetin 2,3-dioxygenase [Marinobacterium nitratireducens]
MTDRTLERRIQGVPASDGAGVRLNRVIGTPALRHLDPFLMLDEFKSDSADDYIAGFPAHPHRGFETVTYMLAGRMEHRDHLDNVGLLEAGGAQWMTAGRGIIHSEMPQQDEGLMWGFQLWVNLPAAQKMQPASYRDLAPDEIPEALDDQGVLRRVIAGHSLGTPGPIQGLSVDPLMVDIRLPAGRGIVHPVPSGHRAFVYVYRGTVNIGGEPVPAGQLGTLSDGDQVRLDGEKDSDSAVLLLAARPIGEPIVQYGPFVMNSSEEIEQALRDYRDNRLTG